MKLRFIVFVILAFCFQKEVLGQEKPVLKFNKNATFRIVQFTDLHFQYNSKISDSVLVFMREILANEKPDLVVLTGDVVTSKGSTQKGWLAVTQVMIDAKIPFAVNLGNHDREYDLSCEQIFDILATLPYNMSVKGPKEVNGTGNFVLEIKGSKSDKTRALLYCFDSGRQPIKKEWGTYDWIHFNQVKWYRETSDLYIEKNEKQPLPALAFFHIPFPEYNEIRNDSTTVGRMEEKVCSPKMNSGLFNSMVEQGDVMGVFVGHDHDSNYSGVLHNICLTYGCVTGKQCYGKIERGARIIELKEGKRKFKTWIYTYDNEIKYSVSYPDSFKRK